MAPPDAAAIVVDVADPASVPQIELVGLRKVFSERGGDVVAVDGADLTVDDGELFAILGPEFG
jgi:putative spermidine/putrescine transport system ATP-binding protein